jgi:hypothetical protein
MLSFVLEYMREESTWLLCRLSGQNEKEKKLKDKRKERNYIASHIKKHTQSVAIHVN